MSSNVSKSTPGKCSILQRLTFGQKLKATANHRFAAACIFLHSNPVEVTGIEPVSKHILQKPSTCLFCFRVSGSDWKQTTDQFLSCIVPIAIGSFAACTAWSSSILFCLLIKRRSRQQDCLLSRP